jgi:hypothetical protein
VQPCWDTEIENANGELSIPIEHLIHHDWVEGEAIEPDMNFELKTVVASEDGKFPQIKLLSDRYLIMTAYYGSRIFEGCNINGSMNAAVDNRG